MEFLSSAGSPWLDLAMMRFGQLRVTLELRNQFIVLARLPDADPGKDRNQKQHRDNRNIVRSRSYYPELMPVHNFKDEGGRMKDERLSGYTRYSIHSNVSSFILHISSFGSSFLLERLHL